jgi:hypothetical protein
MVAESLAFKITTLDGMFFEAVGEQTISIVNPVTRKTTITIFFIFSLPVAYAYAREPINSSTFQLLNFSTSQLFNFSTSQLFIFAPLR